MTQLPPVVHEPLFFYGIARFGVPIDMSSDRGLQFTSQFWTSMAKLLGIQLHHTTAYHPQSNGLVERFHHHLKSALQTRLNSPSWTQELPWVLLGIRSAPKEDSGCSSVEMVYGAPLTVPGEFISSHRAHSDNDLQLKCLRDQAHSLRPIPISQHGRAPITIPQDLHHTKFVFIRCDAHHTPLQRPYEGLFKTGPKTFLVDIGGKTEAISIDRLKHAHVDLEHPVPVAEPRHCGCPLKVLSFKPKDNTNNMHSQYTRSGCPVNLPQWYISVLRGVV